MKRIGIYSGSFNPVHAGHISFALQALEAAKLDKVYLLPERYRKGKTDMAHFGHRVAMIKQAIKPHNRLGLIEAIDVSFSVDKTLPRLQQQFEGSRLVFLFGSDSLVNIGGWPNIDRLFKSSELVIGVRSGYQDQMKGLIKGLPLQPKKMYVVDSYAASVSSSKIREALRRQQHTEGILDSVRNYSDRNWLYISLA